MFCTGFRLSVCVCEVHPFQHDYAAQGRVCADSIRVRVWKRLVLFRHVLKHVLLPIITLLGMSVADLVAGAIVTETVFSWPGIGSLGMTAVKGMDYPVIMGITLFSALLLILGNLLADILYSIADPRIKSTR